jgi:hypothetical protein
MKRALSTLTAILAVAAGTTKLTRDHDTLTPHAKPASTVAARGTGKRTSNLTKIGLLVRGPDSVEVAAGPQGGDSTRRGQRSQACCSLGEAYTR